MENKNIILIECGTTMLSPNNTGIQRVVRSIIAQAPLISSELGIDYCLVEFANNSFREIERVRQPYENLGQAHLRKPIKALLIVIAKLVILFVPKSLRHNLKSRVKKIYNQLSKRNKVQDIFQTLNARQAKYQSGTQIIYHPVLVLLDSTREDEMWPALDQFRKKGGHVCAILYDLIPFTHPQTVPDAACRIYTQWWTKVPLHVDSVICISQSVRTEFLEWQQQQKLKMVLPQEKVGYFYLGAELTQKDPVIQILSLSTPTFLVVGSLEPRKNHSLVLDAFELLWKDGHAVNLAIVGAFGWKSEKLLARIENHAELGNRLLLIRDATDRDLTAMYDKSAALIIASLAEGFGLPIVEAFQRGGYVICSNLPVFKEIAGDHASYFDPFDASSLAEAVKRRLELGDFANKKNTVKHGWINWHESTRQLISRVIEIRDRN